MTILDQIADRTRVRVADDMARVSLDEMRRLAHSVRLTSDFPFDKALRAPGVSFICEVKKASPSKGVIAADFPYLQIAREYEQAGAAALSVLTEPHYFLGDDSYLSEIAQDVSVPVLRKDFVVSPYQIYQARVLGASAVLLICALLSVDEIREYLAIAHDVGMSALVETHDEAEARIALDAGARIIGVNNRDLHTFTVDLGVTERVARVIPDDVAFVSESGVSNPQAVARLAGLGVDAILVGEALMRQEDKVRGLTELKSELKQIKICGLTSANDVEAVNAARPDCAGFVFAESRRQVTPDQAAELKAHLHPSIRSVGVFVDQDTDLIAGLVEAGTVDAVQLHGHETDAYIRDLRERVKVPIIRAIRMAEMAGDREALAALNETPADMVLLDSTAGSGLPFDWAQIPPLDKPFFIAGGVSLDTVGAALAVPKVGGVDVSSGAELNGAKDPATVAELVRITREFGNPRAARRAHGSSRIVPGDADRTDEIAGEE